MKFSTKAKPAAALLLLTALGAMAGVRAQSNCTDGTLCFDSSLNPQPLNCYPGYYCPGNQSAQLCPAGSFCPTSTQIEKCPSGYYCQPASTAPKECSVFESCPSGSTRYFSWGAVLLALIPFIAVYSYKVFASDRQTPLHEDLQMPLPTARSPSIVSPSVKTDTSSRPSTAISLGALTPFTDPFAALNLLSSLSEGSLAADGRLRPGSVALTGGDGASNALVVKEPISLRFDRLVSAVKVEGTPKTIMQSVSGTFQAGRFAAVMGPSGAGKTTLFRILLGKLPVTDGGVYINEQKGTLSAIRGCLGFVPQNDVMITTLSVRDVLLHAARTRMPREVPDAQKIERVDQVMDALSLTHIQNSIIGDAESGQRGISGGERKRVSIGIELVAQPSVLLLDEPTTGLDSTTAADVILLLKRIAQTQRVNVVAVLHQPRNMIFELIDDLLLLAPGGRTVYSGPASQALAHFTAQGFPCPPKTNLPDHVLDVLAGAVPRRAAGDAKNDSEAAPASAIQIQAELVSAWQVEEKKNMPAAAAAASLTARAAETSPQGANWFEQVWWNLYRALLQQIRGTALNTLLTEMSFHLVAGIMIGIAFAYHNWFIAPLPEQYGPYCPAAMREYCIKEPQRDVLQLEATYICMALGLISALMGTRTFGPEMLSMNREVSAGGSLSAYMVGKVLGDLPSSVIYSMVFTSSFVVVCAPNAKFAQLYLVAFLFEFCLYGLGYVCSAMFESQENSFVMAVVSSLLAGLATDNMDIQNNACWARWAAEAIFLSEIRASDLVDPTRSLFQAYCDAANGFKLDNFSQDIIGILVFMVVFRLITYALLERRQRKLEAST